MIKYIICDCEKRYILDLVSIVEGINENVIS